MKSKEQLHIVPLSSQAVETIRELLSQDPHSEFLFAALGNSHGMLSENTIHKALRTMGYVSDDMTAHGFRSMASTLLNEQGWPPDAIEHQLAHVEQDEVKGAYNYAQHLPIRRRMMQAWADYLDDLRLNLTSVELTPMRTSQVPECRPVGADQPEAIRIQSM